jgi:hypothetical protein
MKWFYDEDGYYVQVENGNFLITGNFYVPFAYKVNSYGSVALAVPAGTTNELKDKVEQYAKKLYHRHRLEALFEEEKHETNR